MSVESEFSPEAAPDTTPDTAPEATTSSAASEPGNGMAATEDFGFQEVPAGTKKSLVRGVFDSVASRYDLMNDLMSAGVHRLWKDDFISRLAPRPGQHLLDVAGGTGDIALRFLQSAERKRQPGSHAHVTVCDINYSMLEVGRDRAIDRGILPGIGGIDWVCGDAENLPVKSASFDAYTIAFGLRNVSDIDAALREAFRVLKPGGRFLCLEFSKIAQPLEQLYDLYSFNVLPRLGKWIAGDEQAYRYLAESIRRFPPQEELVERMRAAGLGRPSYRNLSAGIAAIHSAWRL